MNTFQAYEKKVYSQNGEDGIIEYIFNSIGTTNKIAVEIGVSSGSNGSENNTMFLAIQGWKTYWFDCLDNNSVPNNCTFTKQILTADNVVKTFESLDIPKDIDLLSIDIDGNDYHIREALSEYRPRVCIMEYNGCFDSKEEYIMPRNDNYFWPGINDRTFGASLKSYAIQAERMGYDLVYCDSLGINAFFVRKDVNVFKSLTSQEAWIKLWWAGSLIESNRIDHISKLYKNILGRQPDSSGLNHYTNSNLTIREIGNIFLSSEEYKNLLNTEEYKNLIFKNKIKHNIPNIIHQTWKSKTELPENFAKWRNSFLELNSNFVHNLYDDNDNRAFIIKHLPELLPLYNSFSREILRVDFVRAVYLFFYGGIYADMDVQCLKPLDRYLNLSGVYLARMGSDKHFEHSIPNAIMSSSKDCGFWIFYISNIIHILQNYHDDTTPEYITGPAVLKDSVLKFNSDIELSKKMIHKFIMDFKLSLDITQMDFSPVHIMENDIWYPLNWNDKIHQITRKKVISNEVFPDRHTAASMFPNSEMVTYWTATWKYYRDEYTVDINYE